MAVSFNGSSDLINCGVGAGSLRLADNAAMSMCCWVNFASLAGPQEFLGYGYDGANTGYFFSLTGVGGNLVIGSFEGAGSITHAASWAYTWTTGTWHHCYGEYNSGTGQWKLYADGSLVASSALADHGPFFITGREFIIGAVEITGTPTFAQYFNGCMADAAVFNGPLTGTEITNLGNGTLRPNTGMSQTLLGYWNLDAVGSSQTDLSGNANTGTYPSTTPSLCGTSPPYIAGTIAPMGQIWT